MTRERRLAIQMWEEIADKVESLPNVLDNGKDHFILVQNMKHDFCEKHGLNWCNRCWFCQYIRDCRKCPISETYSGYSHGCTTDSLYGIVTARLGFYDQRAKAARGIAKALQGHDISKRKEELYATERYFRQNGKAEVEQ